jgi:hypothetical protein
MTPRGQAGGTADEDVGGAAREAVEEGGAADGLEVIEEHIPMGRTLETPFSPVAQRRERARGSIAMLLLVFLGATMLIPWLLVLTVVRPGPGAAEIRDLMSLTLTPIVGLVGTVTGFYYGDKSGR